MVFDGAVKTGACAGEKFFSLEDVDPTGKRARTHIGIIQDPGHVEPWIIAMYRFALPYMRRFMSSVSVMHDCPPDLVEWLAKGGAQYTSCGTKIRITLYPVGSP